MRDQADVYGCAPTPAAVREWCAGFLARRGLVLVPDGRTVPVYCSADLWVADCPTCGSGFECSRWNPEGICGACGHVYTVEWDADVDDAEQILLARPDRNTRHWHPHKGEKIAKLEWENETMLGIGVTPSPRPDEPHTHRFDVAATAEHSRPGGPLEAEVARKLGTGYVLRANDAYGTVEVELVGHSDSEAAALKLSIAGR